MDHKNPSGKSGTDSERTAGSSTTDLKHLFEYPSIGRLFDDADPQAIETFISRLSGTRAHLERVIRHGRREEAERAARAARAVRITLEFLETVKNLRASPKKS